MKVQHPTFPDVFQDVTDAGPWLEQGWLECPPIDDTTGSPAGDTDVAPAAPKPTRSRGRRNPEVKEASNGE